MDSKIKAGAKWFRFAMACGLLGLLMTSLLGCAMARYAGQKGKMTALIYPGDQGVAIPPAPPVMSRGAPASVAKGVDLFEKTAGGFGAGEMRRAMIADFARKPKDTAPGGAGPDAKQPPAPKRLVIYTAQFGILVSNVEDSMKDLLSKVDSWDGYIQTADLKKVTFRVPAANFDKAVEEISQMGVVTDKQISAEDVTAQYRDVELRLEVAETSRKRLLAILEKAEKAEDILKIENEIRRLTEEIEGMKAQLRRLADQIAFSTITVTLTAKAPQMRKMPRRRASYFRWINEIGAEHVMQNF